MQSNNIFQVKQQLRQELDLGYSLYLKEKRDLYEISNKIRTIQNKTKENGNDKFYQNHNNSSLTKSLNLGYSQTTKHSMTVGNSPKMEQSPYLRNNKSSLFNSFSRDSFNCKSPKVEMNSPNRSKFKTENSETINPMSPSFSPKKVVIQQIENNHQKDDEVKLPPIKHKKHSKLLFLFPQSPKYLNSPYFNPKKTELHKTQSNPSLNVKHIIFESPYAKEMKLYEQLINKQKEAQRKKQLKNKSIADKSKEEIQNKQENQDDESSKQQQEKQEDKQEQEQASNQFNIQEN